MSTLAQITANQQNAQHSTGPRTEEGKANSARNRFAHGLCGIFKILNHEREEEFEQLLEAFVDEHQPSTMTASLLVRTLAEAWWLRKRAQTYQDLCLENVGASDPEGLPLYLRYQAHHDPVFHRTLNEILKMRATRRKSESQKVAESQKHEVAALRIKSAHLRVQTHQARLDKLRPVQPEIGFVPQAAPKPSSQSQIPTAQEPPIATAA